MIRYSKDLKWVEPYVQMAKMYLPKFSKLKAIQKLPLNPKKRATIHGVCHQGEDGLYKILIYTEYNSITKYRPELVLKRKRYSKLDILCTLAHELSHMEYWDHCPKRQILESQLTILFMSKIHFDGYISEEYELSKKG